MFGLHSFAPTITISGGAFTQSFKNATMLVLEPSTAVAKVNGTQFSQMDGGALGHHACVVAALFQDRPADEGAALLC